MCECVHACVCKCNSIRILEHVIVIKLSNILHCNVNDHMPVIWIDKALTFVCYL